MVMFATIIGHEVTGLEVTSAKYIVTVLHDELNNGDTLNKARQHVQHHHLIMRRLTFSPFQRKGEMPQMGFEPTSLFL